MPTAQAQPLQDEDTIVVELPNITEPAAPTESTEMVEFTYKGEVFAMPKDGDDWDTDDIEILYLSETRTTENRPSPFEVVRACLGPDQYRRFNSMFPKRRNFNEFQKLLFDTIKEQCTGF